MPEIVAGTEINRKCRRREKTPFGSTILLINNWIAVFVAYLNVTTTGQAGLGVKNIAITIFRYHIFRGIFEINLY